MNNGKTILIASTSKNIAGLTGNYLKEIGAQDYSVAGVLNDEELNVCLQRVKPEYLLIEASFYNEATPDELLRIVKKNISVRVFVFDYHENPEYFLKSLLRTGVEGFLDMRQEKPCLLQDLKRALAGKRVIPKQFEGMNFDCHPMRLCKLTDRDMSIVRLILRGHKNTKIAKSLHLEVQSVKNRRKALYGKLHAADVLDFLRQALKKGVIGLDEFLRPAN